MSDLSEKTLSELKELKERRILEAEIRALEKGETPEEEPRKKRGRSLRQIQTELIAQNKNKRK